MTNTNFYGMGIAPGLLEVIEKLGFKVPTPIQGKAIPFGIDGKDIIGVAQTGTGKTLAFGIPMIQQLQHRRGRGLVLVPTRELAMQVKQALENVAEPYDMRIALIIGGEYMGDQILDLRQNPRIIIATPGRLIDHVKQQYVRLDDVEILVLDEADRMLDMGFTPQIELILKYMPKERQTLLFSATMPPPIVKIASNYMHMPVRVEIAPTGTTAASVSQELFIVKKDRKVQLLQALLKKYRGTVLVFIKTKSGARKVTSSLKLKGFKCAEIHSDRVLEQRKEALEGFKSGKYRILIATDIASRGIDVSGIELVINYDLPDDPDNYVHRIGRTGRAGEEGHAISFATTEQGKEVKNIEKLIRYAIPVAEHPLAEQEFQAYVSGSSAPGAQKQGRPWKQNSKGRTGRGRPGSGGRSDYRRKGSSK